MKPMNNINVAIQKSETQVGCILFLRLPKRPPPENTSELDLKTKRRWKVIFFLNSLPSTLIIHKGKDITQTAPPNNLPSFIYILFNMAG